MKKILALLLASVLFSLTGCGASTQPASVPADNQENTDSVQTSDGAASFLDADGREITVQEPCKRIISLYSAHTENLYSLGAGDLIIGVHDTSIYPPEAAFLPQFSYEGDPETIIAADPDLVLIRPFITKKAPDFVEALENAGIFVVSLYPEKMDEFDTYIRQLALLTGTEEAAEEKLTAFHEEIENITQLTSTVEGKKNVFFESTEVNLRTATADSMAGQAIVLAGGNFIASDGEPVSEGSSIASYGAERILEKADLIDVYVSQQGAMNAGGSVHAISTRPGFDTIKAVQEGNVFIINEKIISSPTFRYVEGVRELARFMYPELMDNIDSYRTDTPAAKRDLANLLVKVNHLPLYVLSSSKYYTQDHTGEHIYGTFQDVTWQDEDFNAIETAVTSGYMDWSQKEDGQYFYPDAPVTKEDLAQSIFIMYDFDTEGLPVSEISDLDQCEKPNMVQILVAAGVLSLENGAFMPDSIVTNNEIIHALETAKAISTGK